MGMSADKRGDASVDVMRHRHLLARRLGVEIDEHGDVLRDFGEDAVDRLERTVHRLHEDATLNVHDCELECWSGDERPSAAGAFGSEVDRTDDALQCADLPRELLLAPRVVAERDRVRARVEDLLRERCGEPRARRAVLGIDHDGGKRKLAPDALELLRENTPAGTSDDVAYHQYLHCFNQ